MNNEKRRKKYAFKHFEESVTLPHYVGDIKFSVATLKVKTGIRPDPDDSLLGFMTTTHLWNREILRGESLWEIWGLSFTLFFDVIVAYLSWSSQDILSIQVEHHGIILVEVSWKGYSFCIKWRNIETSFAYVNKELEIPKAQRASIWLDKKPN